MSSIRRPLDLTVESSLAKASLVVTVNIHEAKTNLSKLLVRVEEDDEIVVICRNGKPIAELRRLTAAADPLAIHAELGGVVFHEDPTAPLDPEDWPDKP